MIGEKVYKSSKDWNRVNELIAWAGENNARVVDKGDYFECVAVEPTVEEKLAQLDSQYDADVAELTRYYTEAQLEDDAELQEEIKAELAEIKATYVEERKKIEDEEE
jgi:hypothetical protein